MDISVLIVAYDSYNAIWSNFFTLYKRHWGVKCDTIFISNHITPHACDIDNITFIQTPYIAWSDKVIDALQYINTEYVFFILDDYLLLETLTHEEIELHVNFMKQYAANKVMLDYKCPHLTLIPNDTFNGRKVYRLSENSNYLTSMQPSIWRTTYLKNVIQPNWNAWQFEIEGTSAIRGNEYDTYLLLRDKKPYFNAIVKGKKVLSGWHELKSKEHLTEFNI